MKLRGNEMCSEAEKDHAMKAKHLRNRGWSARNVYFYLFTRMAGQLDKTISRKLSRDNANRKQTTSFI